MRQSRLGEIVAMKDIFPRKAMVALCSAVVLAVALLVVCACAAAQESAWSGDALDQLVEVAETAPNEGLPRESALIDELRARRADHSVDSDRVDTVADELFIILAHDFALGRVSPTDVDPNWRLTSAVIDAASLRVAALRDRRVDAALRDLLPTSNEYVALRTALVSEGDEDRRVAIRANMERWRWAPRSLPARRVEVRIPFFEATLLENNLLVRTHRIVVGKPQTPTPSFQTEIVAVTLNPYWTPPASILLNELAPAFARDPARVEREGYEVRDASGALVDPGAVSWNERPFRYQVRQAPGASNALGRLKFEMPNPYTVYLHDTPARSYFEREKRALSHGCMRVQDPIAFAAAIGAGTELDINARIERGSNERIELPTSVPVIAVYLTVKLDDVGGIVFAQDVYRRDKRLVAALDSPRQPRTVAGTIATAYATECSG